MFNYNNNNLWQSNKRFHDAMNGPNADRVKPPKPQWDVTPDSPPASYGDRMNQQLNSAHRDGYWPGGKPQSKQRASFEKYYGNVPLDSSQTTPPTRQTLQLPVMPSTRSLDSSGRDVYARVGTPASPAAPAPSEAPPVRSSTPDYFGAAANIARAAAGAVGGAISDVYEAERNLKDPLGRAMPGDANVSPQKKIMIRALNWLRKTDNGQFGPEQIKALKEAGISDAGIQSLLDDEAKRRPGASAPETPASANPADPAGAKTERDGVLNRALTWLRQTPGGKFGEAQVAALREAGFDDAGIMQIQQRELERRQLAGTGLANESARTTDTRQQADAAAAAADRGERALAGTLPPRPPTDPSGPYARQGTGEAGPAISISDLEQRQYDKINADAAAAYAPYRERRDEKNRMSQEATDQTAYREAYKAKYGKEPTIAGGLSDPERLKQDTGKITGTYTNYSRNGGEMSFGDYAYAKADALPDERREDMYKQLEFLGYKRPSSGMPLTASSSEGVLGAPQAARNDIAEVEKAYQNPDANRTIDRKNARAAALQRIARTPEYLQQQEMQRQQGLADIEMQKQQKVDDAAMERLQEEQRLRNEAPMSPAERAQFIQQLDSMDPAKIAAAEERRMFESLQSQGVEASEARRMAKEAGQRAAGAAQQQWDAMRKDPIVGPYMPPGSGAVDSGINTPVTPDDDFTPSKMAPPDGKNIKGLEDEFKRLNDGASPSPEQMREMLRKRGMDLDLGSMTSEKLIELRNQDPSLFQQGSWLIEAIKGGLVPGVTMESLQEAFAQSKQG